MVRLINPEDWFLVFVVFASFLTFPIVLTVIAKFCKIPLSKVFDRAIWTVVFQLIGIILLTLLLIQTSVHSDGMGSKLIYGRF